MSRAFKLRKNLTLIFLCILILVIYFIINLEGGANDIMPELQGKKILMIIASHDFRDEELFKPRDLFLERGMKVILASSSLKTSRGMLGGTVQPDILVKEVKVEEFEAIIFVGGMGSSEYWEDPVAREIVKKAVALNKIVGAICIAPVTLANAGILEGKKATVFSSEISKLKEKGAIYTGKNVEVDGNIITANGPQAAEEFGKAIIQSLIKVSIE